MKKLTTRLTAMLLAGMLVIGSVPGAVFAADADAGETAEYAEEVFTEGETAEESSEAADAGAEVAEEEAAGASEGNVADTSDEAAVQYYTITLDANGGYFENEWDDAVGDYAERAEVIGKHIPVGGTVAVVPAFMDPDGMTMIFAGWSLERDGELISQAEEEYVPVDNCVLYAVWQAEDASVGETEGQDAAVEENTEQADGIQEFEEEEDVSGDALTPEEDANEEDTAYEAIADPEIENEQDIASDQEAVSADEDAENTSEMSSEAAAVEEEAQPELNDSSEKEETVREDVANGVDEEAYETDKTDSSSFIESSPERKKEEYDSSTEKNSDEIDDISSEKNELDVNEKTRGSILKPLIEQPVEEPGQVTLKDGYYKEWIDRINVPSYALELYDCLIDASDNNGSDDWLIDISQGITISNGMVVMPLLSLKGSGVSLEDAQNDYDNRYASIKMVLQAIRDAFMKDHPEVFWLSENVLIYSSPDYIEIEDGYEYSSTIYYVLQSDIYDIRGEEYRNTVLIKNAISKLNTITDSIVRAATGNNASKVKYFNSWLTKSCGYNTLYSGGEAAPRSSSYCMSALLGKSGEEGPICEGYATAFKVLCDKANIPCTILTGDVPVQGGIKPHAWNFVQIWDKWYAVDVTWNDPLIGGADTDGITSYLLVGSETTINSISFADSHPYNNMGSNDGISFINAPRLNSIRLVNFVPEEDGWRFKNYSQNSVNLTETDEAALRYWVSDSEIDIKRWLEEELHPSINWNKLFFADGEIKKKEWGKVGLFLVDSLAGANCFGMSLTSLMIKNDYINIKEIDENANVLHDVEQTDEIESIIGVHHMMQHSNYISDQRAAFFKKTTVSKIREMMSMEVPYLFDFGHEPSWWHTTIVYEKEEGEFNWNNHSYNVALKVYDPNCIPGSGRDNYYYMYINTNTYDWEIPAYYSDGISSYGGGVLLAAYSDIEPLKDNTAFRLREEYHHWIRSYGSYELLLETKEGQYVIDGRYESADGLVSAYFDSGDDGSPVLNIRLNTSDDYTISSLQETDMLNIKVLTENACVGAIAEKYHSVTVENNGNVALSGVDGVFGISISTENLPTTKKSFVVGGESHSDVNIKQTNGGIEVINDGLKDGMGVLLYNDEKQDEAIVSIDEDVILLAEEDNILTGYIDKDGDGLFEEEINDFGLVTKTVASGSCGENAKWKLDDKGQLTILGTGDTDDWGDGSGAPWKNYRDNIVKLVVEEGITSIGTFGFIRCHNLKHVSLPTTLKSMGSSVFDSCNSLENIKFEEGFETLNGTTFYNCTNLKSVVLPSTLKNLSYSEFYGCGQLKSVGPIGGNYDIQYAWDDSIPENAMRGSDIDSLVIKKGIRTIEKSAFTGCESLKAIEFPESLEIIRENAFYSCKSLENITLPQACSEINSASFAGCSSLRNVYFVFNPPDISIDAFSEDFLTAHFPSGNPYWTDEKKQNYGGNIAWAEWESPVVQVLNISDANFSLDKEKYRYTGKEIKPICTVLLGDVRLKENNDYTVSYRNNIEVGQANITIEGVGNYSGSIEGVFSISNFCGDNIEWMIDDGVLTLSGEGKMDDYGFSTVPGWINEVKSIEFDSRITSIGSYAFWCNYELAEVKLSDAVVSIGDYAFYQDSGIQTISFGTSLSYIGANAFRNCTGLKRLDIPPAVTDIGAGFVSGCNGLNEIFFSGNAPIFAEDAFSGFSGTVYYPSMNDTWNTEKRLQYGGSVTWKAIGGSDILSERALQDCLIELENNVFKYSGEPQKPKVTVFYHGESMQEGTDFIVQYNNNIEPGEGTVIVTGSGNYVGSVYLHFNILMPDAIIHSGSCGSKLKWTLDNNGVMIISGKGAMNNWSEDSLSPWYPYASEIKVVLIEDGVTTIGDFGFYNCRNLSMLSIGKTVTQIGKYSFMMNYSLKKVYIPSNVRIIKQSAFSCADIEELSLENGVQRIENNAFGGNFGITTIIFPESIVYLGESVFDCIMFNDIYFCGNAPEMGRNVFVNEENATVYYPVWAETWDEGTRNKQHWGNITWNSWNPGNKRSIVTFDVQIDKSSFSYSGNSIMPSVSVKDGNIALKKGIDYSISYANNINAGCAKVIVKGKDNYYGRVEMTFTISPISISNATITELSTKTYTGSAITQAPVVKEESITLKANTDYTISYANNTNVGTATVTITGKGNYASKKTATFKINKAAQSITAKAGASRVAVGKTTTVSITGNKGKKSYKSSNTAIATVDSSTGKVTAKKVGTVKITATSATTANYNAASKTVTIKVVPAATTSLTAANQPTGIKLTWKKVTGANGYKIYRGSTLIKTITSGSTVTFADTKANTNGTKYTYKVVAKATTGDSTLSKSRVIYRVSRPAVSSVTNSASKKMTVKWGKNAKANGYQIQYSTDKTFKTGNKAVSITSASTVSKVIGSLTKGKTYYVRIRTYKTVGSTKYWSIWSAAKSVKISK